jgi:hypothetical protein
MPTEMQMKTVKAILNSIPDDATVLDALGASLILHIYILDSLENAEERRSLALKSTSLLVDRYSHAAAHFHA